MARYIRYSRLKQQINFINCNNLDNWIDTCNYRLVDYVDVCESYCNCGDYGEKEPIFQYRWNNLNPNYGYYCEDNNRYYKQRKEVSYDDGKTWYYVIPYEFQKGELYEANSRFCTAEKVMFEYRPDAESEPFCEDYNKMQKYVKNVSFDGGKTWEVLTWNKPDGSVYKEYQTKLIEENSCFCGYVKKQYKFNDEYLCGSEIGIGYKSDYRYEVWREYNLCTNEPTGRIKYMNPQPNCDCGFSGTAYVFGGYKCGSDIEIDGLTITQVENGTIMGNSIQTSEIAFNENLDVFIKFNIEKESSVKMKFQFSEGSNIFIMEPLDKEFDDFVNPAINIYTGSYGIEFPDLTPGEHFLWLRFNNQTNRDNPITMSIEVDSFSTEFDRYAQYEYWYEKDVCTGFSTGEFEYRYPKLSTTCGLPFENVNSRFEVAPYMGEYDSMLITNKKECFDLIYDYVNDKKYEFTDETGRLYIESDGYKKYPMYGVIKYGLTSLGGLFRGSYFIKNFSAQYKPNTLLDMSNMFENCNNLISVDLNGINTSNVTVMNSLFKECQNLEQVKVNNLDTSRVTDMGDMFYRCNSITDMNLANFDTSNVVNFSGMFFENRKLENIEISHFNTSNATKLGSMFSGCDGLLSINVSNFDTRNVKSFGYMFNRCSSLPSIDVSNFDTRNANQFSGMFGKCSGLTELDLTNFDTSNATLFNEMFEKCSSLETLNISSFNTRRASNMSSMFDGCSSLQTLDVSKFNTTNVKTMDKMFSNCTSLIQLDLLNFNTFNVTDMSSMFENSSSLSSLVLSSFKVENVKNFSNMFNGCSSLTNIVLTSWNTNSATNMSHMFGDCSKLTTINVNSFRTSLVTDASFMFSGCSSLTSLNLSNFETNKMGNVESMFDGCSSLTSLDLSKFKLTYIATKYSNMFNGCDKLNHIKCTQEFQNWCLSRQDDIKLPDSMRSGGNGKWEII